MKDLNLIYAVIGVLVLFLGLAFRTIRSRFIFSDPVIALLVGVILGPTVLGLLDPREWSDRHFELLKEAARLTLGIGLMGVALRLPRDYFKKCFATVAILLGLIMPIMWISSGFILQWLLPMPFLLAFTIGAVVTPTDPIVASSIVSGPAAQENLPARLHHVVSAESGANDGLAYPFVILPMLLMEKSTEEAIRHWLLKTLAWEIGVGVLMGIATGYIAGRLLTWSEGKKMAGTTSFLSYSLALSVFILGAAKLAGIDGILAVFAGGLAYDRAVGGKERAEEENVQEAISQFFTLPAFALIGLSIPTDAWLRLGWKGVALVVAILLLRRLPAMILLGPAMLRLPDKQFAHWRDIFFSGWFGPVGIAAFYYACESTIRTGSKDIWPLSSLIICASILAHGLSANKLISWYGKSGGKTDVRWEGQEG